MNSSRGMYIRNTAYIPQNWKDIRIADITELSKMSLRSILLNAGICLGFVQRIRQTNHSITSPNSRYVVKFSESFQQLASLHPNHRHESLRTNKFGFGFLSPSAKPLASHIPALSEMPEWGGNSENKKII